MIRTILGALVVVGLLTIAAVAMGQTAKVPRIGVLSGVRPANDACLRILRQALTDLGHIEGKTHVLEVRWADGGQEPFPALARPGGNVTGSAQFTPELMAKRVQVLKEAAPNVSRVAVIREPGYRNDLIVRLRERRAPARRQAPGHRSASR